MVKRKKIQSIVRNDKTIIKKSRRAVDVSGRYLLASSGTNFNADAASRDVTDVDSTNCLYEDVLIEIFKWLPVKDRIIVERVCKRWNKAAKKSWFNFRYMRCPDPVGLKSLLRRAGKFVDKLDMSNSDCILSNSLVCGALSLAPNVRHLKLDLQSEAHVLSKLVEFASQLKSLSIHLSRKPVAKTLNKLLSKCNQLEHLELTKVKGYNFECLPYSLKSLVLGDELNFGQLMELIIAQKICLESLTLPYSEAVSDHCRFLIKIDMTKLRHLSTFVCDTSWSSFATAADRLSSLVSLNIWVTHSYGQIRDELVDTIVKNMGQLKYLILIFCHPSPSNIANFADLRHLTHVCILSVNLVSVCQLLLALVVGGNLEYFYTDSGVPFSGVCFALSQGRNLTHIYVEWVENNADDDLIGVSLSRAFGEGTSPDSPEDPRIRHIYCGYRRLVDVPFHPWAVFHNVPSTFPHLGFSEYEVFSGKSYKW